MARVVLAVFCQSAIIDSSTNNLSIINQFDEVHPTPPPENFLREKNGVSMMSFPSYLACVWERDKPEISEVVPLRIRLISPTKRVFSIAEATMDLRKHRRARLLTQMPGFPVSGEGTYTFVYEIRRGNTWKRAAEVPLWLTFNEAPGRKATQWKRKH